MSNPLQQDLDHILAHTEGLWEELRGQRIFITGGTGFFGCWLLESFCWANDKLRLGAEAVVLTRDPGRFSRKVPHLAVDPAISMHYGDVRDFEFPVGPFSHVIHAATEAAAGPRHITPLRVFEADVHGTRHVLEFARTRGARRFLFTSSGAVYGKQPTQVTHLSEDYPGAPDTTDPSTFYGQAKRMSEYLCTTYSRQYGFEVSIARCFAFVGAYMPFDANLAIGNFIRDARSGGPIGVNGDGTPYRSYLYAADLAAWLWTILINGKAGRAYNVGSDQELTIAALAQEVADVVAPGAKVRIAQRAVAGNAHSRYVPSIDRVQQELRLSICVPLRDAIRRTAQWLTPHDRAV